MIPKSISSAISDCISVFEIKLSSSDLLLTQNTVVFGTTACISFSVEGLVITHSISKLSFRSSSDLAATGPLPKNTILLNVFVIF